MDLGANIVKTVLASMDDTTRQRVKDEVMASYDKHAPDFAFGIAKAAVRPLIDGWVENAVRELGK